MGALTLQRPPRTTRAYCRAFAAEEHDGVLLARRRVQWQQRVTAEIQGHDALLIATVLFIAPPIDQMEADGETDFRVDGIALRNPSVINFLDGCAGSLPCHQPGDASVGLMPVLLPVKDSALLGWTLSIERCLNGGLTASLE
ncbi:hypothetical protein ACLEC3_08950 [Lonsdalea quercina]